MSVIRVHKNKNFTVMSNVHLRDIDLSLKAKGLLSVMLSLPDNWNYSIAGLCSICKENETAIKSTIKELKEKRYVIVDKKFPNETESKKYEYIYNIFEEPQEENQSVENQGIENLPLDNLPIENHSLNKRTDIPSTDKLKTDTKNTDGLSTDSNSFSNEKDNSKPNGLELHNSQVGELGTHSPEPQEDISPKTKSNITMTLGRKERPSRKHELQDMPTRAKEIAYRLTEDKELSDKAFDLVRYFMDKYKKHSRHEHLNLRNDTLESVITTILSTITVKVDGKDGNYFENDYTPLVSYDVSPMDYEEVIDKYFATEFREDTDYSIVHFTNENVLPKIMNKCTLNGDHWYESHEPY